MMPPKPQNPIFVKTSLINVNLSHILSGPLPKELLIVLETIPFLNPFPFISIASINTVPPMTWFNPQSVYCPRELALRQKIAIATCCGNYSVGLLIVF